MDRAIRILGAMPVCAWLLSAVPAMAQTGDVFIEQAVAPRTPIYVAPGGAADWVLTVRNDGDAAIPLARLRASPGLMYAGTPSVWSFAPPDSPRCSDVRRVPRLDVPMIEEWEVDIGGLQPGERIVCRYPLQRAASSTGDALIQWRVTFPADDPGPAGNSATWVAGTLAQLTLTATPTCDGNPAPGTHHVRVTLSNLGPTPVEAVAFGRCPPVPPLAVSENLPGSCPRTSWPGGCFAVGTPIAWGMPESAPDQSHSCLLALSPGGSTAMLSLGLPQPYASDGSQLLDLDPQRGRIVLAIPEPPLICGGSVPATPVPGPRSTWQIGLLTVLLLWLAGVVHGRGARSR